jgi:hypothetical protein
MGSYGRAAKAVLQRAVTFREVSDDEIPMLAVLLGHSEALIVTTDGRHSDPLRFIDDVWATCRHLIDPVAVGFLAEFFIRPLRAEDVATFQSGQLRGEAEVDPEVRTGWGGVIVTVDSAAPESLLWVLRVADDGARTVDRMDDPEAVLSPSLTSCVEDLLTVAPEYAAGLTREDRRVLFEYVRDSLPAIGLLAERVERHAV